MQANDAINKKKKNTNKNNHTSRKYFPSFQSLKLVLVAFEMCAVLQLVHLRKNKHTQKLNENLPRENKKKNKNAKEIETEKGIVT